MITTEHCIIRTAETDDAATLCAAFDPDHPLAFFVGGGRELNRPSVDEICAAILESQKRVNENLYVFEDTMGVIRAFGAVRSSGREEAFGEFSYAPVDRGDYSGALVDVAYDFIFRLGFERLHLNKLMAHCILPCEVGLRQSLADHGFVSTGIQRQVVYTQGKYYDLEALQIFRRDTKYAPSREREHVETVPGAIDHAY